jgi:ADP-ribose pyrophosphatase YjhB (NUDIX family)
LETRIYWRDRFVELSDGKQPTNNIDNTYVYKNKTSLSKRLDDFEKSNEKSLRIIHSDKEKLFAHFKGCFKYLEAAGGVVTLRDGRILVIKRQGKWDLPKGKVKKKESLQEGALREVREECGLKDYPEITEELTHTYHTYFMDGKHILKHTAWYVMLYEGNETLKPQLEEDIIHAVWFPKNLLTVVRQNTYQSIIQVLDEWVNHDL